LLDILELELKQTQMAQKPTLRRGSGVAKDFATALPLFRAAAT